MGSASTCLRLPATRYVLYFGSKTACFRSSGYRERSRAKTMISGSLKRVGMMLALIASASQSNAKALTLPMTAADIRSAIKYGASAPEKAIVANPVMQFGTVSRKRPWGCILTPYEALAFASSQAHANNRDVDAELLRSVRTVT